MKSIYLFLFIILIGNCVFTQELDNIHILDEVEISTNRNNSLLKNSPEIVRIVTKQEISQLRTNSLGEVLDYVAGINVETGTGGGFPKRAVASMNGFPEQYSLILINGTRVLTDHIHSGQNINLIPVEAIERIEVIKSASSVQYGSDALAGVINIITQKAGDHPEAIIYGEGGSYDTYRTGASVKTPITENIGFYSFVEYEESDGMKLLEPEKRIDLMGYTSLVLSNRVTANLSDKFSMDAWIKAMQTTMDWTDGDNHGSLFVPNINMDYRLNEKVSVHGKIAYTKWKSERNSERNSVFRPELWTNIKISKNNSLLAGADFFLHDFARKLVERNTQNGAGIFVQNEHNFKNKFILLTAIRMDVIENLNPVFTPKLSMLYNLNSYLNLRASISRGFHAPTVQELYEGGYGHGGTALRFGNPDLIPEYSTSYSFGTDFNISNNLFITASVNYSNVDNMIVPVYMGTWSEDTTKDVWMRQNILKAEIITTDIGINWYFIPGYSVSLSYNYSDNFTEDNQAQQLPYKPGQGFNFRFNGRQNISKNWSTNQFVSFRTMHDRSAWKWSPSSDNANDDATGLIYNLDDYQKLDAGVGISFKNKYDIYFNVSNIFGQDIQHMDDAFFIIDGEPVYRFGVKFRF
jgi:outer membrane receptor for ferrienterochelin and colicin